MICPNCGFISADDFLRCPQCGNETTPAGKCSNCGAPINAELSLYCENCGAINLESVLEKGIVCDIHIENQAIGFCVVCGKAVCEECAESYGDKLLCDDLRHRAFLEKWTIVYTFDFEYEATMLHANLEQKGIDSEVFTKLNPNAADSPFRPTIVEVLVPNEKLEAAQEVVESLGLGEEDEENEN